MTAIRILLLLVAVAVGLVIALSLEDMIRYLKIRSM